MCIYARYIQVGCLKDLIGSCIAIRCIQARFVITRNVVFFYFARAMKEGRNYVDASNR